MKRSFAILVALVCAVGVAAAQPPGNTPPNQPPGQPAGPNARIQKIKTRIRAMRAQAIVDAIQPNQVTAGKLFTTLDKYDAEFDRLLGERAGLQRRLLNAGTIKDPRTLDKLIDDSLANQRAFWDTEERRIAEIRKQLTPEQTAKLLVVLPEFERRLQNQLRAAIQQNAARKGGPPPPRGKAPSDDDME
jgi:hypothetical protein